MLGKFGAGFSSGGLLEKPIQRAIGLFASRFSGSEDEEEALRRTLIALIKTVLSDDGRELSDADYEAVRYQLRDYPPGEIRQMLEKLRKSPLISASEAAAALEKIPDTEKEKVIRALLTLAIGSGRLSRKQPLIQELASRLGMDQREYAGLREELLLRHQQRRKIIKSGAGIVVALIVLVVFILTATLLRSVIFGLIAAYIMLPVEQYFERRLADRHTWLYRIFRLVSRVTEPLNALSRALRRSRKPRPTKRERTLRDRRTRIARAVSLTCGTLLLFLLAILVLLGNLSAGYVAKIRHAEEKAAAVVRNMNADAAAVAVPDGEENAALNDNAMERFFAPVLHYLDNLRDRFDRMPLVQSTLAELSRALNDEASQRELVKLVLKRTGGFFSFTASVFGALCNLLLDLLLTVFFFLLFLTKLAEFCSGNAGAGKQSEYLVRTVFNGSWLPGANEETLAEAERIISEVIGKLKTWLRGYLSLVLIDATVYTTMFYFLQVPYFFILGPLAGCGVLLPYIGPVASAVLTVLVTLAVDGAAASTLQICGIIGTYLIYNGIIEQFILYPVVIGESLGLSTLETIIVVLLGAIFAGITGMILAIPAAAVLKYLVPQIYHCLDRSDRQEPEARP